ncbi:SH3 domain-containing protein [Mesorhizobium sp. M1273]|uniref:SH3 domain-containing protein n=1 Tax=Mesorhizobium sp. M1273 TaxID=2957075 RepID=UPI0033378DE3
MNDTIAAAEQAALRDDAQRDAHLAAWAVAYEAIVGVAAVLVVQTSDTKPGDAPNSTLRSRTERQEPLPPPDARPPHQNTPITDSAPAAGGDQKTPSPPLVDDLRSATAVELPPGEQFPVAVVSRTANIRSDPSMAGAVLSQAPAGTALTVVEVKGRWVRVSKDEVTLGWISRSLLEPNPSVAQPSYQ